MQKNKSKTVTLILLLIVTIATGVSAIYVSKKLQTEEDISPEDSAAASRCYINNCNESKICEWPKTSFCTCDSNGHNVLDSQCVCMKCNLQDYYNGGRDGSCRPEEVYVDNHPGICTGAPPSSYYNNLTVCPQTGMWEYCGNSITCNGECAGCTKINLPGFFVKTGSSGCGNTTYIYTYCREKAQPTITPNPTSPPTNTPKITNTPKLTDTPMATDTPTNTPIPTTTLTNTPLPTATLTNTPTNTPLPTATITPSITPTGTILPSDTPTITPTFNPSLSVTPTISTSLPVSLPSSGIMSSQLNRVILGIFMVFTGWTIYWLGLESSVKVWLGNIKQTPTYRKFYKKIYPNNKDVFFDRMKKKVEK